MRVLVVATEPTQLETLRRGLFVCGHCACSSGAAFDLLLADVGALSDLPRLHSLRAAALPLLIVTGLTDRADLEALAALGAPVLVKPFTPDELDAALRAAAGTGPAKDLDVPSRWSKP